MRFQTKPHLFFIFIVAQFSRENCTKLSEWFSDFFVSKKWKWLRVSYNETGIKLWNHQFRSGKKNETDGLGEDEFIILASFIYETTTSFIFGGKKTENIQTVSCSFTWNWPQKKMRFLPKTFWNIVNLVKLSLENSCEFKTLETSHL